MSEVLGLLGSLFAIAVIGGVEITDAVGLAQRFHQEGVVGPAGTRNLFESDSVLIKE